MNNPFKSQIWAVIGLLFTTFVWGLAFILVKMTIKEMNLYYFLFLRFGLAALLMFAIFHKRILSVDCATIKASFILSLMLATSYISQTEGLRFTSAANSALITGLYMVMIPVFCVLYDSTKVELISIFGIVLAFFGMYLLTAYSLTGINIGDLITLICAVVFAWHFIFTGKYAPRFKLVPLVTFQFFFTAIFCAVVAVAQGGTTIHIPTIGIITILFTVLFATIAAFLIQTAAQRVLSPTRAGIICSMEAFFGALIPWVIGFERPTTLSIVGAGLMITGMIVSELKLAIANRK